MVTRAGISMEKRLRWDFSMGHIEKQFLEVAGVLFVDHPASGLLPVGI